LAIRKLATASEIQAELRHRIQVSPQLDRDDREIIRAPMPIRLDEPDHRGCNWTVPRYPGPKDRVRFLDELVRAMQAEFNLQE
jgi:hypothetical protein